MVLLVTSLLTSSFATPTVRAQRARTFRAGIEELGGLWHKAGQLLGLRRDIFPEEFCDELAKLQDLAPGFDATAVRAVFAAEFGAQPEQLFAEFDVIPIATGSVGQVHTAVTQAGIKVAVKVQRPNIEQVFQSDLRYIRAIVSMVMRLHWLPYGRWDEMLWELERMMAAELDYRFEAANIRRMHKTLRAHKVYAPRVFAEYTTRRVLVMEYIDGVYMSDYIRAAVADPDAVAAWCAENHIDPALVGWRLYASHTRQVYEDNLFHSDLLPGNIVLLRDSRLGLIDFGSVGSIETSKLRKYYMIFEAVAEGDFNKVADLFLLLTTSLPSVDVEEVKSAIIRVMRTWEVKTSVRELPYHEKSLTNAMNGIASVFREYHIPIAWELMRVNRAELTLDFSLMYLLPDANYHRLIKRYARGASQRALGQLFNYQRFRDQVVRLSNAGGLPANLAENVEFDAEWVRRRAMVFERELSGAAVLVRNVLILLARVSAVFIGLIGLMLLDQVVDWWPGQKATELITVIAPGFVDRGPGVAVLTLLVLVWVHQQLWALVHTIEAGPPSSRTVS
jgi:ubiquinone biosynthesis protein